MIARLIAAIWAVLVMIVTGKVKQMCYFLGLDTPPTSDLVNYRLSQSYSRLHITTAFDNLQVDNTDEDINVEKILVGQIMLLVAKDYEFSFPSFFAMVGPWNSLLLRIYAAFNLSKLMK